MTHKTVANHACQSAPAPVATPRRYDLARCLCPHAELRGQYITHTQRLGTLMRHFFLPPARPIAPLAPLAPGMGAAPFVGALVPPACLALPNASCLIPTRFAAITLAPLTVRAHQDHAVAMHARQWPSALDLPIKHWHSPWSPECPQRRAPDTSPRTLDSIERRCNNLHAPVADTVGRASRNNFPLIPAVAPVLFTSASASGRRLQAGER